jgi:hypothetical protein
LPFKARLLLEVVAFAAGLQVEAVVCLEHHGVSPLSRDR